MAVSQETALFSFKLVQLTKLRPLRRVSHRPGKIKIYINTTIPVDSLNRPARWEAMGRFKIPPKIINIIKAIYRNYRGRVRHEGKFETEGGVKQVCYLQSYF